MRKFRGWIGVTFLTAAIMNSGCGFERRSTPVESPDEATYHSPSTRIDYPDVVTPIDGGLLGTQRPLTVLNEDEIEFEHLTLQEAVRTSLQNSRILRDLGGLILRSPGSANTTYDVALQELDPRFGVASALSEFDANFATNLFFENNDKALNNDFVGGGTRRLTQDYASNQSQLSKKGATGTEYALRSIIEYDNNNAPGNKFPSIWNSNVEASVRHPLMRGGGTEFNRIAGPNGSPGNLSGVVLARINTDISLAQFELAVRDFVSNVENAYWDLYFAYRDLDAKIVARDNALTTWNAVRALYEAGRVGGEAEKEAQAREQYLRLQEQVQNALSGRLIDATATNNGSAGGSFRANGGVMTAERKLRLIMGVPINDGKLFRPDDEPIDNKVIFDWDTSLCESLQRRPELRRQKWIIKRREQEFVATANFLLPQLDLVGLYRWRGFGDDLLDQGRDRGEFDNAVGTLMDGKFQEWQVGVEFSYPFGRRKAHAARQHAEMQLTRERMVLAEQEREVVHQLSNSVAELDRAYAILENATDRRIAAAEQLEAVQAAFESDKASLDLLLRTQQGQLEADTSYFKALVDYMLAIRNVHYEKGSLLDYNEIYLTEDVWPLQAYHEARERNKLKVPAEWMEHIVTRPEPVTAGEYQQDIPGSAEGTSIAEPIAPVPTVPEQELPPAPSRSAALYEEDAPVQPRLKPRAVPASEDETALPDPS